MAFYLDGQLFHNLKPRLIVVNKMTIKKKKDIAMHLSITLKIMQLKFDRI